MLPHACTRQAEVVKEPQEKTVFVEDLSVEEKAEQGKPFHVP